MSYIRIFFMSCLSFLAVNTPMVHGAGATPTPSPYAEMNYTLAFNQTKINQQYHGLLEEVGCSENVFDVAPVDDSVAVPIQRVASSEEASAAAHNTLLGRYQRACLWQLKKARYLALTEPAQTGAMRIGMGVIGYVGIKAFSDSESISAGFALMDAFYAIPPIIKTIRYLIITPENKLSTFEDAYALNQCFIPRDLWPQIIYKFKVAHDNQFELANSAKFIEFALGLKVYCEQPPLIFPVLPDHASAAATPAETSIDASLYRVKETINERIDAYFRNYNLPESFGESLEKLKDKIGEFINALKNNRTTSSTPRFICLQGLGGVGKGHFVASLSRWLNELLGDIINYQSLTIPSAEELEGSEKEPGLYLAVLQKQLQNNKRGSVVFVDEASWLTDPEMVSTAKRVFNGPASTIKTTYLGRTPTGRDINLAMPPLLIFLATNEIITDEPLKARFAFFHFPSPSEAGLIERALAVARANNDLRIKNIGINQEKIRSWIGSLSASDKNFRYVEETVVAYLKNAHRLEQQSQNPA